MTQSDLPKRVHLTSRIASASLTAGERRIGEYLLSIPEHALATLTAEQLADATETSRSTVARLASSLGYRGFRALRNDLLIQSRSLKGRVSTHEASEIELSEADAPSDVAYKVFNAASVRSLRFAEMLAAADAFPKVIEAFRSARTIMLAGAGSSALVALDMQQRLMRLGLNINFAEDHHTQLAQAALATPEDLVVCVSFSGSTRLVVRVAEIARGRGATTVGILARDESPLAELCDLKILTPPGVGLFGTDAVMTRLLQMMFNEVLFHCLMLRDASLAENVDRINEVLDAEKTGPRRSRTTPATGT